MNLPAQDCSDGRAWKLLLAGVSSYLHGGDEVILRRLLLATTDWEPVFALADRHGVSSLLHRGLGRCGDAVPAEAALRLGVDYERNIHKTLFLARELIRVLDCMDALGVDAIPYKGLVLAEGFYGDMAMRQSGDMDLFVRAKDVSRIKRAVLDLGYTARLPIPDSAEAAYIASGYECSFDSTAGKNLLELQWDLQPRFYAVDYGMDGLFDRAQNATAAGRNIKTLSPEDLLLVLSLHAAKHVWGRLIWLCDVAQIARRESLKWDWIRGRARELGIERILHVTLRLTNHLLGGDIPAVMAGAISADRSAQMFADKMAASIGPGVGYEEQKMSYFRLMMQLRERPFDRLRFFSRLAFTPGPGEWEAVKLPKRLFPLYRIVRLARLLKRFAN